MAASHFADCPKGGFPWTFDHVASAQRSSTQAKLAKLARTVVRSSLVVENVSELERREYEMTVCV